MYFLGGLLALRRGRVRYRVRVAPASSTNAASASEDAAILDDQRVRRALFAPQALTEKQNSGVLEISPDTMVAVRVEEVIPAHVPELQKVKAHIVEILKREKALAAAALVALSPTVVYASRTANEEIVAPHT